MRRSLVPSVEDLEDRQLMGGLTGSPALTINYTAPATNIAALSTYKAPAVSLETGNISVVNEVVVQNAVALFGSHINQVALPTIVVYQAA